MTLKKHGIGCWHNQRYRCQSCRKTFQINYTYHAYKPEIKEQIVYLAMNNAGIRDTARALHISINAAVRALKKLSPRYVITFPLDKLKIVLICKVDEMWLFVMGKKLTTLVVVCMGTTPKAIIGSCIQHIDIGVKYNFCRNKLWQLSGHVFNMLMSV